MCTSVQFRLSVMSDSFRPHRLQHARLPCPSPIPRAYSNSCPLSRWCHRTISSSVVLLPPSIFPSIRVFSNESVLCIRWPKFGVSVSASVLQGTLKRLLQHHSSKVSILLCSAFFIIQLSHPYMTTEKTIALTRRTFVGKAMSLLFNMLSRLLITFLPRSKRLLISWLQSCVFIKK